ncbi:MAG TPA: twin-arginine translocase subunit TatC, partial [Planctomycetota bacterium]|nr:twin-arginine translocase subunit TatC [Planctomycetota bacterium]
LVELRARLLKAIWATLAAAVVTFVYGQELLAVVIAPYQEVMRDLHVDPSLKASGPAQPLVTVFKVSLVSAAVFAAPVWIYQLWAFIGAGLYSHEKRYVRRYLPLSLALFVAGVLFGYFLLLPIGLRYLTTFIDPGLVQMWTGLSDYLSLFATLTLLLGAAFQLPVVMLGLAKSGMVTAETFRAKRKVVILILFIVAGIITPPDPVTQSLVAVPLCLLYQLGIVATSTRAPRRTPIDRRRLFRALRWPAIVLLAVVGFRGRIARALEGHDIDRRAETFEAPSAVPWRTVGRSVLGREPTAAYRLEDSATAPLLAVFAEGRVAAIRFRPSAETSLATRVDASTYEVLALQGGSVLWHAELPADLPLAAVVGPLADAWETGGDQARAAVGPMLRAVTGVAPEGERAEAARAWLAAPERAGAVFRQP